MPGNSRFTAMAVAAMTVILSVPSAYGAASADCWLMDDAKRAEAAEQGLCRDAFARNGPVAEPPSSPSAAASPQLVPVPPDKPKAPSRRTTRNRQPVAVASSGSSISASSSMESGRSGRSGDFDFFGNLRRDFNSVLGLLAEGGAGARPARSQRSLVNER